VKSRTQLIIVTLTSLTGVVKLQTQLIIVILTSLTGGTWGPTYYCHIDVPIQVVRSGVPHVSLEDDKLEETVPALWERFLAVLQDAVEQVNLRTPLITQNLDDKLQVSHLIASVKALRASV